MDNFAFLAVGIVIGAALGAAGVWVALSRRANAAPDSTIAAATLAAENEQLTIRLAEKDATIAEITRRDSDKQSQAEAALAEENRVLQMLAPVKQALTEMKNKVEEVERERTKEFTTVGQIFADLRAQTTELQHTTQGLKNSLGNANIRGAWGEIQLERVVEAAGLLHHVDFTTQTHTQDSDGTFRPDMVITLPDNKTIVIDSKVPLTAYLEAMKANETGGDVRGHLKNHAKSMREHVKVLSDRKYWERLNSSADYVIMFVPSDAMLSEALEADTTLFDYALNQKVALVSPVSLFTTLKAVGYIWKQQQQSREVVKIVELGQELYKRLGTAADSAAKVGRGLATAVQAFNDFAGSFETRLLVHAKKFPGIDIDAVASIASVDKEVRDLNLTKFPEPAAIAPSEADVLDEIQIDFEEPATESTMDSDGTR
ncbi:MAG: recombination protein RmuC [Actinomycetota bacterium]